MIPKRFIITRNEGILDKGEVYKFGDRVAVDRVYWISEDPNHTNWDLSLDLLIDYIDRGLVIVLEELDDT
jgi:hypothetical protein